MIRFCVICSILTSSGCVQPSESHEDVSKPNGYWITVTAGDFDRTGTIVSFPFPDALPSGTYSIKSSSGETIPLQVDENNTGWFILQELSAGNTALYYLSHDAIKQPISNVSDSEGGHDVGKHIDAQTITFTIEDKPVLSFYHSDNTPPDELDDRYKRGGYIHPVHSPDGTILTSHLYPGYPHHSGIWSAWSRTEYQGRNPDFWNIHNNTGRVDVVGLDRSWSGMIHAGMHARNRFTELSTSGEEPVTVLQEKWEVTVYGIPGEAGYHMFDLKLTQTVNLDQPVKIRAFHYGGLGFRGHLDWTGQENGFFLTSTGLSRDGNETRARWVHFGGRSDGVLAGIAVLGHPENHGSPQPLRIHPELPFFSFAPTQLGDMEIGSGAPYSVRYRFITYDGEPNRELIDQLWNDYAYPPGVTVKLASD
jgi:hypothetical protein